jgi:hypothetical protein
VGREYVVTVKNDVRSDTNDISELEIIIEDPLIHRLQYLIINIDCGYVVRTIWDSYQASLDYSSRYDEDWGDFPNGICQGSEKQASIYTLWDICGFFERNSPLFSNLKGLYVRDFKAL